MAGDQGAAVLDAGLTLHHRLCKVAKYAHADQHGGSSGSDQQRQAEAEDLVGNDPYYDGCDCAAGQASIVFLGLISGKSGRFPNCRPTRYAPVSLSQVAEITNASQANPRGFASQSFGNAEMRLSGQARSTVPGISRRATAA